MKKINLIEWLWKTDSHEKQTPQRFKRYAGMLMMLLTLGVGQMWATDLYVRGKDGNWDNWQDWQKMSGTSSPWTYIAYWGSNSEFKIATGDWTKPNLGGKDNKLSLSWGTKSGALYNDGGSNNIQFPAFSGDGGLVKLTVTLDGSYYIKAEKLVEEGSTAYSISSSPYIYFNVANASSTYTAASILLGKSDGSQDYAMSGKISGTQLFYKQMPNWSNYKTFLFIDANNWGGSWSREKVTQRIGGCKNTNAYNTGMSGNFHMFTVASGDDNADLSYTSQNTYGALLNKTQTVEVYVKVGSGSYTKRTSSWPGTLTPDRYYMSSATATTHANSTALTASSSVTVSAVLTSAFSLSESSTATGYNFDGWGTSSSSTPSGKNAAYSISSISGANTICAFFTAPSYSITYHLNSGTQQVSPAPATSYTVESSAITLPTPTRDGYNFDGWFDNSSFTGSAVTTIAAGSTGNKEYWAKWTSASTATLTYHANYIAGTGSGTGSVPAAQTVAVNANATVAGKNTLAFVNYTFSGWNTEEYITGTHYNAGDDITMSDNINLYAEWTRPIPMDDQGATTGVSTTVYGTYNCTTLTEHTNPAKTGYTFGGWYSQVAGAGSYVISPEHVLQAKMYHWTDAGGRFTRYPSSTSSLYAKWTQSVILNANTKNHGSGSNGSATATWNKAGLSSKVHTTAATGYTREGYYTAATGGTKILNADGSFAGNDITVSKEVYISDGKWMHPGATTLYAHYTPNNYTVTLKPNGGSGDDQVVTATYDATMPTTLSDGVTPITAPSRTGYTFDGFWGNSNGTGTKYYNADLTSNTTWGGTSNTDIYAKWNANQYTVTLDIDEPNHGTIDGKTTSQDIYYDAVTVTVPKLPTAANGYALDGYYTDHDGEGTKLINADGTWIASVTGYTDADRKWIRDGGATLYAYYKKAEITELTVTPAVVATEGTVAATPTIDPMPEGTTEICWELQYSNGTPLPSQPIFSQGPDNSVIFTAPSASATYRIQATLRKGSTCNAGDVLSTEAQTFQVAGEHTVTVQYQDGSSRTLKDTIHVVGKPLEWSSGITAPTITGYTFARWDAGDGVTIKNGDSDPVTTSTDATIYIKAVYDGTLTAVYNKKKMIFFNNTLGWDAVYVYFYKNANYWDESKGAGTDAGYHDGSYSGKHGAMTQIDGTNIYYFDAAAASADGYTDVAFTEKAQDDCWYFYENNKVVKRGDYNATYLPMFVPLADQMPVNMNGNTAKYYNKGYWMNYPENTGYTLKIYNKVSGDPAPVELYSIPFEFTEDFTMPMELDVDLEAGQTYGFKIKRADDSWYGNNSTITANATNWAMETDKNNCGLQTTAAGTYTFNLYYGSDKYRIDVTYPVAVNDYRIVYTDGATWSKAAAHGASWYHPSGVITKNSSVTETKKDTVSFFWSYGSSPAIGYQTCSAVAAGSASWSAKTAISVSSYSSVLTKAGVYNFIFEQPAGGASISLIKVEPYTGNFYIRTDCAGSTKWSNFRATDHQMTYSDYAKENSGFTHYFVHWVTNGNNNIKFVIANDYSMCISDTLVEDKGTVIANIIAEGNADAGKLQSGDANIRFMWNQATNKISRAYISGSSNISDRFLVLEGDAKMYDEDGNPLTEAGGGKISGLNDNEINLVDDQNFLYERIIKVNTSARAKLTAKYNSKVQYFKGSEGAFAEGTTVELLGGSASGKHKMRIVYDFKTNRLVTAYLPEGEIDTDLAINADLMLVREHQEEGQQITFNNGSLTDVHTVYGVMRFNRWTLNNKEKTGAHGPVGDPKSVYERSLYWISFPFDVNLSDVFGFGTYGEDWIIEYYDGESRAANGYWIDSPSFWRFVMPAQRPSFTLEAGKGYVLALEIANMKYDNTDFWTHNIEQVELFFPSAENVGGIEATNVTTSVHEHACTIDRTGNDGPDINKNRTRADSHWNMIGVPSYANYGETLTSDGSTVITWNSAPYTNDLPFLYEWNMVDDSYTVQSGTTYPFKSMHSYMVQYHGNLCWHLASATPASAPRLNPDAPSDVEFRLELQQNDIRADQTFVKLSNNENVSADFVFDEDLSKEFNKKKANIYTLIDYIPAAGNVLPLSTSQKTIVPVGVQIKTDGEYTFAMPDGTDGIGVTLIDNETGEYTNLGLTDYTVNLNAGSINDRFVLEISPVSQTTTDIEEITGNGVQGTGVRKVMIDGILYIVRDGQVFDARGARVQ